MSEKHYFSFINQQKLKTKLFLQLLWPSARKMIQTRNINHSNHYGGQN